MSRLFIWFLAWALLSTLTIGIRFGYISTFPVQFGLLKLVKLALYGIAGWVTIAMVRDSRDMGRFLWAFTVAGLVISAALLARALTPVGLNGDGLAGYRSDNAVSVGFAIVIVFLGTAWASGWGPRKWRWAIPGALATMTLGFAFSPGRGGWLAAIIGILWFLYRRKLKARAWAITAILVVVAAITYQTAPTFRSEVVRTINPDPTEMYQHDSGWMGVDEGGRLAFWHREGIKLIDYPILGRGFFNRFPGSGLDWVGSHNFWLQMFLETGIPGGAVVLALVWTLWRQSKTFGLIPLEAALLAGFVGGMGGEYFYGGMPLFTIIAIAAPLSLARNSAQSARNGSPPGLNQLSGLQPMRRVRSAHHR